MKLLVTGGAGYIGSQVVRELIKQGYDVVVLDDMEFGHKEALPTEAKLVMGNVGNEELLHEIFKERFDGVMHFAGYIQAAESVKFPHKYLENNLMKSSAVLREMLRSGVNNLIFSSTAAIYGDPEYTPIDEAHPKKPTNAYGLSKWQFEQLLEYYDRKHGLRSIALRYFNACGASLDGRFGEAHRPETHLIPLALAAADKGKEFELFGTDYPTSDGTCVRDYVHVEDLARVHIKAIEALKAGHKTDQFNVGSGKGWTNRQVVAMVEKIVGKPMNVIERPRRDGDAHTTLAKVDKIAGDLGWKAEFSDLETIIKTAWEWQSKHPNGYGNE